MVIVVAVGLSITSISLKDRQQTNMEKEKKQSILSSIGVECSRDKAVEIYDDYVKKEFAINNKGEEIISGKEAFNIKLKEEYAKEDSSEMKFPVYKCENQGQKLYVFPVRGKGLWGPIWGYVALKNDFNTIFGVTFDHKSETPGLGAEITTTEFQKQFIGKKLFDDTKKFVSVLVKKPGKTNLDSPHEVDGLSGSTLTSNGLEDMLYNSLKPYEKFFKSH